MNKYYNYRNSKGQFTRKVVRAKSGKFAPRIVPGRLYEYKGAIVRAHKTCPNTNSLRYVTIHKRLAGYVLDRDLKFISKNKVAKYLSLAE